MQSFRDKRQVPAQWLAERLETVRELAGSELEMYEIAKDRLTGEHYLHYAYVHRNLSDTGAEESFHQLLPLDSDDVLGLLFNGNPYQYPEHWRRPFLRNGPEGFYVWFDPVKPQEEKESEELGRSIREKLERFKSAGSFDQDSIRKLLEDLNQDE